MGAEPYEYFVPYEADIQAALEKLRQRVFQSGAFFGAELGPATPQEALEMAEEDGTRSILDILQISDSPDFCCAAGLTREELVNYFGTEKPTRDMIAEADKFWEDNDRGTARYVIVYKGNEPKEIFFGGYSFD